nr:unnamed protein product [Callosobruchus analis]
MTPQLLVPNPKNTRFNIASQELKFDFGFIPAGAQMGLLGIVKIRFPVYSGWCTDGALRVAREHHKQQ